MSRRKMASSFQWTTLLRLKWALLLCCMSQAAYVFGQPQMQVGSEAELWFQQSVLEKKAYINGFCEGLRAFPTRGRKHDESRF